MKNNHMNKGSCDTKRFLPLGKERGRKAKSLILGGGTPCARLLRAPHAHAGHISLGFLLHSPLILLQNWSRTLLANVPHTHTHSFSVKVSDG